jgi:hypothetical protein
LKIEQKLMKKFNFFILKYKRKYVKGKYVIVDVEATGL